MCGICGVIPFSGARESLEAMTASLAHRGPDQKAVWVEAGAVGLGARRLAVLDLEGGDQPRTSEDGSVATVLNGEIYNYRELRSHLESRGHALAGSGDAEVLPHLYEEYGDDFPGKQRGMFAFALWDSRRRRLLLGRDRLGIKPLYYSTGRPLAFASEVRALRRGGYLEATLDPEALDAYLSLYSVPGPRTLYAGARALEPGHLLILEKDGTSRLHRFWSLVGEEGVDARPPGRETGQPDATEGRQPSGADEPGGASGLTGEARLGDLRRLLEESVQMHLASDVPLGIFLSGGQDSTLLLALATRLRGEPLDSFSVGFGAEGAHLDESAEAAHQARRLGSQHHRITVSGQEVARDLPLWIASMDLPTGDGIQTWYVSRVAAEQVTVALSGLGGDELFGGYRTFHSLPRAERLARAFRTLPASLQGAVQASLDLLPAGVRFLGPVRQLSRLADAAPHGRAGAWLAVRSVFSPAEKAWLLEDPRPGFLERQVRETTPEAPGLDPVFALELTQYMRHILLRDADATSMAHSLEVRVPFLDHPLVEWAARQPASIRLPNGGPKPLLVEAFRDLLDQRVLAHPKQGFSFPLDPWMRGPLRPEVEALQDQSLVPAPLRPRAVARLARGFLQGHKAVPALKVWTLVVLRRWLEVA